MKQPKPRDLALPCRRPRRVSMGLVPLVRGPRAHFALARSLGAIIESQIPKEISAAERVRIRVRASQFLEAAARGLAPLAIDNARAPDPKGLAVVNPPPRIAPAAGIPVRPEERIAYRINEVAAVAGVSPAVVRKHIEKDIETRKLGRGIVLLNPEDVHRAFGFTHEESVDPSAESLAEIEELLT